MRDERNKVWIHSVQTRLFVRVGLYWLFAQVCLWNFVFIWRLLQEGPGDPVDQYLRFLRDFAPVIVGSFLLVPALAWDAVKFAHRILGPIHNLRKSIKAVTAGEPVRPVRFRKDDFLPELRDEFNHMLEALQRHGVPALKPADPAGEAEGARQTA